MQIITITLCSLVAASRDIYSWLRKNGGFDRIIKSIVLNVMVEWGTIVCLEVEEEDHRSADCRYSTEEDNKLERESMYLSMLVEAWC